MADPIRRTIAVVTDDVLSDRMAGPAIRAFNVAAELSAEHEVTLVSTRSCTISDPRFACLQAAYGQLRAALADAEIVVVQGYVTYSATWLIRGSKILVIDLYDPMHFEQLEQTKFARPGERRLAIDLAVRVLNEQIVRGDFFMCASTEQRHMWLGHLAAFGRINPATYERDATLDSLIEICPFGLPEQRPAHTRPAIRGVVPGIAEDDRLVLWAGGVYNWFDPLSLVAAVDRLRHTHPDLRLYFLGMKHPNPKVREMATAWQTRELADRLGLTDRFVFFNEGWVDYEDRQNYLLEADVGVSTHLQHVETTFAFRTRILDYLWAGLPIVTTEGDTFGTLVAREGLGVAVPEQDVDALVAALTRVVYDEGVAAACRAEVQRVRGRFTWSAALAPLLEFCRNPRRAPDAGSAQRRILRSPVAPGFTAGRRAHRAYWMTREAGPAMFAREAASYVRRRSGHGD